MRGPGSKSAWVSRWHFAEPFLHVNLLKGAAMTSVRVPGFLPSANGLHFPDSWPSLTRAVLPAEAEAVIGELC